MTSRSIYQFLLRLHPSHFRKQFEDQMLCIFDESVGSRGAASLLIDGTVSLFRQWILRSTYWRHAKPSIAASGDHALADALHRNSERLYRRAWWINILWMAGALIVLFMCPMPYFIKIQFGIMALNAITLLSGKKQRRNWEWWPEYTSLFYYKNTRDFYRTRISAKRDGLRAWVGKSGGMSGSRSIVAGSCILFVLWFIRPAIRHYQGLPDVGLDWDHSKYFIYGFCALVYSWRFLQPVNESAARAIQQEIDAMDAPSSPHSI